MKNILLEDFHIEITLHLCAIAFSQYSVLINEYFTCNCVLRVYAGGVMNEYQLLKLAFNKFSNTRVTK